MGCLRGVFARAVLAQENSKRRPDVFFFLNLHSLKIGLLNLRKKRNHTAAVITGAKRLDFAVAKKICGTGQLLGRFERGVVVGFEIVAVGAVKYVDVPERRMITLFDDLERLGVSRRDKRAARLTL